MTDRSTRRDVLTGAAGAALAAGFASALAIPTNRAIAQNKPAEGPATRPSSGPATRPGSEPFGYCLNASTINWAGGSSGNVIEQFEIAAKAGFGAVEPWVRDLEAYEKKGGSVPDLAKRVHELGLEIPSAIGFAHWIVDDDADRAKGLEQMKRDMDLVARVGGKRIAAPPIGANDANAPTLDLRKVTERYRALLELGDQTGVVPELEIWGPSKNLSRVGEGAQVAIDAGHPKACILADVYHMYKGGSRFEGLALLSGTSMHCLHVNDYPADPPRERINDANRVYPGDGIAPLHLIFRTLRDIGYTGWLSLELFNRDYWKQSPQKVAQTGIEKLRASVRRAFA
jgi:2-keto-myo-inositol isomerase